MRKLFLLLIVVMVLGICVAGPAKAEVTLNDKLPFDMYVSVPCANGGAGELVHLTGFLHVIATFTFNENNSHVSSHFQPMGVSGVGQTTGDKYQATGVTRNDQNSSFAGFPWNYTFVNNFRIIGKGAGNNYLVHQTVHFTVNANGDATATVDNFTVDCK